MGASTEEATALRPNPYAHETLLGRNRNSLCVPTILVAMLYPEDPLGLGYII